MIWFNHTGPIQPVGSVVGTTTVDGKSFTVWEGQQRPEQRGPLRRELTDHHLEQFRRAGFRRQHGNP